MDLGRSRLNSKIAWEKMMSKNSIPQIRFQGFDSWWETIKLTDLGISVGGTAIESEFDPDGKYKVISIGSYSEESKYKDQGIRAIYSKKTEKRILEKDDLTMILNDKTSTGKIIGRVLLIDEDNSYVYNQRTQRICLDKNKYVPDFIFQLLNADTNRNKIVRSAQGNTQIYVNWSDISNLDYLIPDSFDEQSAIGSLFRNLDDLLASYKDNLANYQSLKATMLFKMFPKAGQTVPEIRLDGFEGEWEVVSLGTLIENYDEIISGESGFPIATSSRKGLYLQNDYFEGGRTGIDLTLDFHRVPMGYVTYRHMSDDSIFKFNKNNFETDVLVSKEYPVFISNDSSDIDFLLYHLNNSRLFLRFSTMQKLGGTRVRLYYKNLITYKLAVPTLKEQQAIGSYFSNLDNLIITYQEKISQLETLKKKLLQDMFV